MFMRFLRHHYQHSIALVIVVPLLRDAFWIESFSANIINSNNC